MDLSEPCEALLRRCPDPPARKAVETATRVLTAIQALDGETQAITPLGRHLADLPCDPSTGRLLVYGALLGVTFHASAVAAALGTRSPFLTPPPTDADGRQVSVYV
jgi:hypothetical protein